MIYGNYFLESKKLDIPQEIINFNKTLNKDFSYGVVYKGKVITNFNEFNFFENYKSLTIREFEKYKTGICWDFVHYEANWFKKHGYEYETYYIEGLEKNGDPHTHTFLLFYLNDSFKTYYFESAWEEYKGIEEFDNTTKALKTIKERHIKDYKGDIKDIIIVENDFVSTNFEGLSCEEYMIKASKGKTRFSLDDYKICYRVTYKGEDAYQALKNELIKTEEGRKIWNQFLDNEDWLDKTPSYSKNNKSYFTKSGLDKFKKSKDYELMKKYLKDIDIEIIEINNKNIKYEDQYQVVVTESKEINIIPQEIINFNKTLYFLSDKED